LWFPLEKSRARAAAAGVGARRWTRNRPEDWRAVRVSDGRRTLNEMTGEGWRVTVLKEETVMPRKAFSMGPCGSVAVIMATG
jgi:Mg-chelatase subunit ChlD